MQTAGGEHLHGVLGQEATPERHHRCQAPQADVYARRAKSGVAGGDRQVGTGYQLAARGRGDAFHARDYDLRLLAHRLHHGRAAHRNGLEKFRVRFIVELGQVVPGAKNSLPDTAQNDHADAGF